ncbi:MAG: right-handed parallel beta-helix repeat-containing protein, partial [Thermogemmata sp.]|nr:right-handed parallel beta-helix repeat-containing protein [Thermogemmata sp.]
LYASPQQRRGERADPRDDVHAFGVMGYQMVVGRLDVAPGPGAVRQLQKLGVPDSLVELILACVDEEAEERLANGMVLVERLDQVRSVVGAAGGRSGSTRAAGGLLGASVSSAASSAPSAAESQGCRRVRPGEDLARVIASVSAGSVVELAAGVYRLSRPLVIDKSVRLRGVGAGVSVVVSGAEGSVVEFRGGGVFGLAGVTVRHVGDRWADTVVVSGGEVVIRRCRFEGAVHDSENRRGGSGLWLRGGTVGVVAECESVGNGWHGIEVGEQARVDLLNNRCEKNKRDGIAYHGSAAGTAQNNLCAANEKNGIYVEGGAHPDLLNNRCENNMYGIAYRGFAAGTAKNNVCVGNAEYGISVSDDARPQLSNNHCKNNPINFMYELCIVSSTIPGAVAGSIIGYNFERVITKTYDYASGLIGALIGVPIGLVIGPLIATRIGYLCYTLVRRLCILGLPAHLIMYLIWCLIWTSICFLLLQILQL